MFYDKSSEVQEQKDGGCPIPVDTQGHIGWGSEQPALTVGIPVHCRGVGLDEF